MARYQDPNSPGAPSGGVDLPPYRAPTAPAPIPPSAYGPPRPPVYPTLPQAPYGQAGYQAPQFPGFRPTQEFAHDPTTANYESLMNFQIPYYMQPVQQTNYLAQTGPQYQQLMNTISGLLPMLSQASPGENALMGAYGALMGGGGNADRYANEYRDQLKQDPFTGAEWEAYRTEALDPIEADRTTAINRALREISDQGIDPSSGIAQAKLREVNAAYDANRAGAQNALAINANQLRSQRQGQAFQAGLSAEELKQRGYSAASSAASGAANAWSNRLGQMLQAAGYGNDAAMSRARMGYDVDFGLRGEQNQNFNTAMALSQMMANLPSQRQAEALQLISQGDPSAVLSGTSMIGNQRANQAQITNQAYGNTWGGLGSLMGYLGNMFPTSTAPVYRDPGFTTNQLPFDLYGGAGNGGTYYPGG